MEWSIHGTGRWETITHSQSKNICSVIKPFGITNTNTVPTPLDNQQVLSKANGPAIDDSKTIKMMAAILQQEAIGSLLYVDIYTRSDIVFTVQTLYQFSNNPGPKHWTAVKHVIQYLKGTEDFGVMLGGLDLDTT